MTAISTSTIMTFMPQTMCGRCLVPVAETSDPEWEMLDSGFLCYACSNPPPLGKGPDKTA
jgi:hypothetical protein